LDWAFSIFKVSNVNPKEGRPFVVISNRRAFAVTSLSSVCALMVMERFFASAAFWMGTVTAMPLAVVPFFFASAVALLIASCTALPSMLVFPFLSGVIGLVWLVVGISGLV